MYKLLIVDDEEDLSRGLALNLKKEGYEVLRANNGEAGLRMALLERPDLILLDVLMPVMNGFDVCREIRRKGIDTRIIMLTAKTEEIDKVVGLEIGADDYVGKPFSTRELIARIHARLRERSPGAAQELTKYRFDEVEIDFTAFQATKSGKPLEMTLKELEVLRYLIDRQGEVVTREQLLNDVWGYDKFPTTRTVDVHVLKLRKKLEADPSNPKHILSVYGGGYRFVG